jgi:hypothetical protein
MNIIDALILYHFSGSVMGKVLCLYLLLLLLLIIVPLYAFLSGIYIKTINIWRELNSGFTCLLCFVTLFHVCNYGHCFANIVRYQKTLNEHTQLYMYLVLFFYVIF